MPADRRSSSRSRGASKRNQDAFHPRVTEVSRQALSETPERALAFLRGVSTYPLIHAELAQAGYTSEAHAEGLRLLGDALELPALPPSLVDHGKTDAFETLAEFAKGGLRRARAALSRLHPAEADAIFSGLDDAPGPPISVGAFLERVDKLERGGAAGRAAVATLASRGITKAVRDALAESIAVVESFPESDGPTHDDLEARRQTALFALRAWLLDWSETAHVILRGRESRVRLGLARRQRRTPEAARSADQST